MKKTYSEKLKDPRWQKKRLEILNRDEWSCQSCLDPTSTLHVHHRRYLPGKEPWDIPDELLVTLCEHCHNTETELTPEALKIFSDVLKSRFFYRELVELANGFNSLKSKYDSLVTVDVIKYWIGDEDRFEELADRYFKDAKF